MLFIGDLLLCQDFSCPGLSSVGFPALVLSLRSSYTNANPELSPAQPGGEDGLYPAGAVVELGVQVERRVDVRQVAERLREVAQSLAGQPDLLGIESQVVGVSAHLLKR